MAGVGMDVFLSLALLRRRRRHLGGDASTWLWRKVDVGKCPSKMIDVTSTFLQRLEL
jgi:hypothetical protein